MRTTSKMISQRYGVNPFTTGNPFLGKKLLGFNIGRGSGALQGLRSPEIQFSFSCQKVLLTCCVVAGVSSAQGGLHIYLTHATMIEVTLFANFSF